MCVGGGVWVCVWGGGCGGVCGGGGGVCVNLKHLQLLNVSIICQP